MSSLRDNFHHNNYPESITSARRNLDCTTENNTWKLITICLPYVKDLIKKIQKICSLWNIRTVFRCGLTLWKYLFGVKPSIEYNMTKNYVYSIPCSCGKVYKGETCRPLKITLEEHGKEVVWGEIEKSGMADHIWKEKENHLLLWDEVKMIDWEEHWRVRRLKQYIYVELQWPVE